MASSSASALVPPKLPHGRRHDEILNPRKLFVGGVSKAVGQEEFREYWKQFGELEDCVVMVDPVTQQSRGFGFVVFANQQTTTDVLSRTDTLSMNGRRLDVKQARPRNDCPPPIGGRRFSRGARSGRFDAFSRDRYRDRDRERERDYSHRQRDRFRDSDRGYAPYSRGVPGPSSTRSKKLFVGGLSDSFTSETLRTHFEKWGKVEDATVMTNPEGRSRRFGFVRFFDPEPADLVLADRNGNVINGVAVTIEKAVPKDQIASDYVPYRADGRGDSRRRGPPDPYSRSDYAAYPPPPEYGYPSYHSPAPSSYPHSYPPPPAAHTPSYSSYHTAPPPPAAHYGAPPPAQYGAPPPAAHYGAPPPAPSAHSAVAAPYASYSNPYATAPATAPAAAPTAPRYQYSYPQPTAPAAAPQSAPSAAVGQQAAPSAAPQPAAAQPAAPQQTAAQTQPQAVPSVAATAVNGVKPESNGKAATAQTAAATAAAAAVAAPTAAPVQGAAAYTQYAAYPQSGYGAYRGGVAAASAYKPY